MRNCAIFTQTTLNNNNRITSNTQQRKALQTIPNGWKI